MITATERQVNSRNTRLAAELAERLAWSRARRQEPRDLATIRLLEALGPGQERTDEELDQMQRDEFLLETAYACGYCGHVFVEGDVVYREPCGIGFWRAWRIVPFCQACADQRRLSGVRGPWPCEGGCGVLVSVFEGGWNQSVCCSPRCVDEAARKRRRVEPVARECEVCGEEFIPKRSDARYCSSACRQDAYRKRKLGA